MIKFIYAKTTQGEVEHLKGLVSKNRSLDDFDLIIAEDRFTLSLENELLDAVKGKSSFSFNVFSFARLANTLSKERGDFSTLSKTGGVMAISKILLDVSDELKCYKKLAGSYSSLSSSLFEIIAQLKSSMIGYSDLLRAKSPSAALSNKANDIGRVFEEYEKFKKSDVLDAQDKAELLAELIPSSDLIKNSRVILIGFTSFTKQFYKVIGNLFIAAKDVIIYTLSGENDVYDKTVPENLEAAAKAVGKPFEKEVLKENLSPEIKAVNDYLFSFTPKEQIKTVETKNITLKKCASLSDELEYVAKDVLKKVRQGARFSDFAVLSSSVETDGELMRKVFDDYGIPAFLDEKVKLSSHVLAKTVVNLINLSKDEYLRKNSSKKSLFTVLYSPYVEADEETKQGFENYLLKYGVKKSTLKKPLEDECFELVRSQIFSLVPALPSVGSVSEYVQKTKELLSRLIDKNEIAYELFSSCGEKEFAALTTQSGEKINEVLDELSRILGETTVTVDDFVAILVDGLSAKELSLAPLFSDAVFVGDFSSSKILRKKHLYAVSVNNKLVPLQKADVGLFTDKDIDALAISGVDLEPKIELVNEREKLNVFLALHNFEETLTLSYSDFSTSLEALGKSEVITSFEDIFTTNGLPLSPSIEPLCDFTSDEELSAYIAENLPTKAVIERAASAAFSDKAFGGLFVAAANALNKRGDALFSNISKKPQNYVESAFSTKRDFSVSDLESYFSCPYKNFVAHSLYAKDREEAIIKAYDSGNYIHKALELFMAEYDRLDEKSAPEFAKSIAEELKTVQPYETMNKLPRFKTALSRLDKEFFDVANELIERKALSDFKPLGEEIRFGYGKTISVDGKVMPLSPLKLSNGELLRGSIDYADFCDGYARVIDYKTGQIHKDVSEVFIGHKFQPYIYLAALKESLGLKPSAALYFPIHADFSEDGDAPYKMQGYVLKNENVVKRMDKSLETEEKSNVIKVKFKKDGDFSSRESSVLSPSEFDDVILYSEKLAEKATNEIRRGLVAPNPYSGACDYCEYKGICGYDPSFDGERKVKGKVSVETITEAVKDE